MSLKTVLYNLVCITHSSIYLRYEIHLCNIVNSSASSPSNKSAAWTHNLITHWKSPLPPTRIKTKLFASLTFLPIGVSQSHGFGQATFKKKENGSRIRSFVRLSVHDDKTLTSITVGQIHRPYYLPIRLATALTRFHASLGHLDSGLKCSQPGLRW